MRECWFNFCTVFVSCFFFLFTRRSSIALVYPFQQAALIRQLQEQHYQQYMSQVGMLSTIAYLVKFLGGFGWILFTNGFKKFTFASNFTYFRDFQVYAQQAEAAVPESERRPPQSAAEIADEQRAHDDDSDVSDEEPGDDLPCESNDLYRFLFLCSRSAWRLSSRIFPSTLCVCSVQSIRCLVNMETTPSKERSLIY